MIDEAVATATWRLTGSMWAKAGGAAPCGGAVKSEERLNHLNSSRVPASLDHPGVLFSVFVSSSRLIPYGMSAGERTEWSGPKDHKSALQSKKEEVSKSGETKVPEGTHFATGLLPCGWRGSTPRFYQCCPLSCGTLQK